MGGADGQDVSEPLPRHDALLNLVSGCLWCGHIIPIIFVNKVVR